MAKVKTTAIRRNVMRTLRGAEERGFRFSDELKEKLKNANWQTLKQYQKNSYQKLYKEATAELNGDIVSGTVKRAQERSEAAQKGAITRKERRDRKKAEEHVFRKYNAQGSAMYNNLRGIVAQNFGKVGAVLLNNLIDIEVRVFGYDKFIASLALAPPEIVEKANQLAACDSDDIRANRHEEPYDAIVSIVIQCQVDIERQIKIAMDMESKEEDYGRG